MTRPAKPGDDAITLAHPNTGKICHVERRVRPLEWMPVLGHPLAIRAVLLDRRQADINHGQTLERLAERGGLSLDEAAALALRRRWAPMTTDAAMAALKGADERYVPAA